MIDADLVEVDFYIFIYARINIYSIGSNDIYYMNFNPKGNKCIRKTQTYFLNCR